MKNYQEYLIALGGNLPSGLGTPEHTILAALEHLDTFDVEMAARSRLYSTPCFPPGAGPDYVNAAAKVAFEGEPRLLLTLLHRIEARFGRDRAERWGRRTLDIDLIAAGDTVLPDADTHAVWRTLSADEQARQTPDRLILPHPRLQDRAFVLVPLAEVAPDWVHPILGRSVSELLADLPRSDLDAVLPL